MTDGETASTLQPFNASVIPERHRALSLSRILAITSNTLTELTRLKVFYVLLVFGLLLIGSSIFMAQFSFQQEFQILKDVSLGAISMFTSLLAIVATARMLPRDIEDRTVYTILAKPVPPVARSLPGLEFFNGLGGFADRGREYVTILGPGQSTPAPWINVVANPAARNRPIAAVTCSGVDASTPRWLSRSTEPGFSINTSFSGGSATTKLA